MLKKTLSAVLAVPFCVVGMSGQTAAGGLQGTVTDTQGAPLGGAQVNYQRVFRTVLSDNGLPIPAPGEAVLSSSASTDATGAFTAPSFPPGDYLLCASVPSTPYLDPCRWASAIRVTVSASAVGAQTIALTKGVFLNVRINDPLKLLPQTPDAPLHAGKLIVGVQYANGAYLGVPNTSIDSSGRSYQIAIPAGVPLKLWLFGNGVTVTDSSGKAVGAGGSLIPFQATAGQDQSYTFSVSAAVANSQ